MCIMCIYAVKSKFHCVSCYVCILGNSNPGDWWNMGESEPSMGSTVHLNQTTLRGPELANSMMELDGPFTNVNKGWIYTVYC